MDDMLTKAWNEVDRLLRQVDFGALWPGFTAAPFALYDGEKACLDGERMTCPAAFRGNTALDWQGRIIAIWRLEPGQGGPVLAADLVHEMFHVFQHQHGECRWPDDLAALDAPQSPQLLSIKLAENRLLLRAAECSGAETRALLARVCALRRWRQMHGSVEFELRAETVEGMAEYMGNEALCQLDPLAAAQLRRHRWAAGELLPLLLDARQQGYLTGPLLLTAARAAHLPFFHTLSGETHHLSSLIAAALEPLPEAEAVPEHPAAAALVRRRQDARRAQLAEIRARCGAAQTGCFRICGYDPVNMWRLGDVFCSTHFWRLYDVQHARTLVFTGECLLYGADAQHIDAWQSVCLPEEE